MNLCGLDGIAFPQCKKVSKCPVIFNLPSVENRISVVILCLAATLNIWKLSIESSHKPYQSVWWDTYC